MQIYRKLILVKNAGALCKQLLVNEVCFSVAVMKLVYTMYRRRRQAL